jgi:hypothetical protein
MLWWVRPKYDVFSEEEQRFGQSYIVELQEDIYSRSRPPLKSGFASKEAAEKWLKEYLDTKPEEPVEYHEVDIKAKECLQVKGFCTINGLNEFLKTLEKEAVRDIVVNDEDSYFVIYETMV